jgi:hypothetical protein
MESHSPGKIALAHVGTLRNGPKLQETVPDNINPYWSIRQGEIYEKMKKITTK